MAQLLITGGAGFIGSHACLSFLDAGYSLVVIDNYSNGSIEALRRVAQLSRIKLNSERLKLVEGDISKPSDLEKAFSLGKEPIEAVVHFAGLKAVGDSFEIPLRYWRTNVTGSIYLLEAMKRNNCKTIVFSSSATVYGLPKSIPIRETSEINPINPYGKTKAAVENILFDLSKTEEDWRIACLRYFNPVGAHSSGMIGEDPNGTPNNLFPFVSQVAVNRRSELSIFGSDWPTSDGSAIRDYIHVIDLVEGHRAALNLLLKEGPQAFSMNLGSGKGHTVFEVVSTFESVVGRKIPCRIVERRPGDIACSVADSSFAKLRLGWETRKNLLDMCKDSWVWQKNNPFGYKTS